MQQGSCGTGRGGSKRSSRKLCRAWPSRPTVTGRKPEAREKFFETLVVLPEISRLAEALEQDCRHGVMTCDACLAVPMKFIILPNALPAKNRTTSPWRAGKSGWKCAVSHQQNLQDHADMRPGLYCQQQVRVEMTPRVSPERPATNKNNNCCSSKTCMKFGGKICHRDRRGKPELDCRLIPRVLLRSVLPDRFSTLQADIVQSA